MNAPSNKDFAADTMKDSQRYMIFSLNHELYCISIDLVREVIATPNLTPIPRAPHHFKGLMNLRGKVLTVIDLRTKLNLPAAKEPQVEAAVVVIHFESLMVGIAVDFVAGVTAFASENIQQAADVGGSQTSYVLGVINSEGQMLVIVDIIKLLDL